MASGVSFFPGKTRSNRCLFHKANTHRFYLIGKEYPLPFPSDAGLNGSPLAAARSHFDKYGIIDSEQLRQTVAKPHGLT